MGTENLLRDESGAPIEDTGDIPSDVELTGPPPIPVFSVPVNPLIGELPIQPPLDPESLIPYPDSAPAMEFSEPEIVTVPLFISGHEGYGDANQVERKYSYNRVYGSIDPRWPGQFRWGNWMFYDLSSVVDRQPPRFAVAWENASGVPLVYWIEGRKVLYLQTTTDGTEVSSNVLGADNCTSGMFHDAGDGVPYLYASFGGTSSDVDLTRMNRARSVSVASSELVADLLLSLNGSAYLTQTPSGGSANCVVRKCPAGSDPLTPGNWGPNNYVGFAGTNVNALTSVRQAPVAIKPEGIFAYNESLDRWVNYAPSWTRFPHPDNGKGAFSLGDLLIIPMGNGGAVLFDGYTLTDADPIPQNASPNQHTTSGSFLSSVFGTPAALGAMRHWIVGVTKPGSKAVLDTSSAVDSSAMRFFYYDNSITTYTDHTLAIFDTDPTSAGTMTYDDTADYMYLKWDYPFCGFTYKAGVGGTFNAVALTMTVEIYNGSSWITQAVTDLTATGTSGSPVPLAQDGVVLFTTDPIVTGTWAQTTVNSVSGYWCRIKFSGSLTASVTWNACRLVPWYPSVNASLFATDGLDRGSVFPHLLFGKLEPSKGIVWHDMGTIDLSASDDYTLVHFGQAPINNAGSSPVGDQSLMLFGRQSVAVITQSLQDRPDTDAITPVDQLGLYEGCSLFPAEGKHCRLLRVRVYGDGGQNEPSVFDVGAYFFYAWDRGKPWIRCGGKINLFPDELISPSDDEGGTKFRWSFGFTSVEAVQSFRTVPGVTHIEADFEVTKRKVGEIQERSTPPTSGTTQASPRF